MPAGEVLCRARGIRKDYPGLRAVDDAHLEIRAGEVVGLLGKNGAGKSTLIKILAGVQRADAGTLELGGERVDLGRLGVAQARALGLAVMFQELELFPGMSVAENIVLTSRPPRRRGLVDFRAMRAAAAAVLATVDPSIDARAGIDALPPAQQRAVMIARAVHQGARLLILDEPTTSLTTREIEALHALVRRLAAAGHAVVYVSHRLDEVRAITDRVVVMRDGAVVASRATGKLSMRELVATISGNDAGTTADERRAERGVERRPVGPVRVAVSGLTVPGVLEDISFEVRAGEILGIGGLVGAGRTELVRALFGADPIHAGTIAVDGEPVRIRRPRDAVREGIVLLPEDRRHQGLVDSFGIRENTTLATLSRFRRRGLPMPSRRREGRATTELMDGLKIRARGPEQVVASLSGGNQQKVVIAKWMLREGKLLMFDEPTQGIDVEAKEEVYTLMERFADGGASVLLISSEFSELVGVCRRVIVLREGAIAATLEGADVTERTITDACYGASAAPTA